MVDDIQEAYLHHKNRLLASIDSTQSVLADIRAFNKDEWVVRYPQLSEENQSSLSLSFADDPSFQTHVVLPSSNPTKGTDDERLLPSSEFNILKLDLKLGTHTSSAAASLVHQLEKASIANLLDERIGASFSHIGKLRLRVEDTSSKVLVTGDLNAGKSTFVNALLRREVMPVDQQPCTTAFCEVHDAAENDGREEIHVLKDGVGYNIRDESTYIKGTIAQLDDIVADNEQATAQIIKVYLANTRAPSESLLNNGVVDISLIDAPGLNRDSLQTTAVFARQEEIDVVVFVASAENHLTLSAKEFLFNASQEKAYLFVVVNKYDHIRNKEKCRKNILEQIKQLSPRTYEDADDLVHFVDSAAALQPYTANPAFDDLESALRSFVLVKRSKSKLQPVTTYLQNILSDVQLLSTANSIVANHELQQARLELSHSRPILEKLRASRETLDESLEAAEEDNISLAVNKTKSILINALDRVGQGSLAVPNSPIQLPSYPGFFGIWEYARDIRKALLVSIDAAVKLAEDEARIITTQGVEQIQALQETYLPEGVERSRKVFVPEAMFSINRRGAKGANRKRYTVVAGGTQGLGIGLTARPELLETTFFDLFDVNHQFMIYFPNSKSSSSSSSPLAWDTQDIDEDEGPSPTALSVFSLGLGALTMVGGQAIGARGLIEAILRLGDLFSSESSKKWVAPVLCVTTLGLGVYLVFELPSTIPRTVGRRVRLQVLRAHRLQYQQTTTPTTYVGGVQLSQRSLAYSHPGFVEGHGERVGKETRKVLKLKAFDIKKRYLAALEERQKEVRVGEELETKAQSAMRWFEGVGKRVEVIKGEIKLEELVA